MSVRREFRLLVTAGLSVDAVREGLPEADAGGRGSVGAAHPSARHG